MVPPLLEGAAVTLSVGLYVTLNRIVYTNLFLNYDAAVVLCLLGAVVLAFRERRMSLFIPLAGLSFLFPTAVPAAILIFSSLRVKLGGWVRWPLLMASSAGLAWSITDLLNHPINVLALPIELLQGGLPSLIPVLLILGIIPALIGGEMPRKFAVPSWSPYLAAVVIGILPFIEQLPRDFIEPETVDWIYYYNAILHPQLGWFLLSRPAYIGILYLFSRLFGAYNVAVYQFPFLALLYASSAYYMAASWRRDLASASALLAVLSPMLLTFLYSGLQANLFSISIMFFSLGSLMRGKWKSASILSYLALASHIYAWAQLEGATLIYVVWKWWRKELTNELRTYAILTAPPFLLGIALILGGFFSVPYLPLNPLEIYRSLEFQFSVLSWGSANALIYYLLAVLGNRKVPGLSSCIYTCSIGAMLLVGTAQNLVIDLPLFLPATAQLSTLTPPVRKAVLLALLSWAIVMTLSSVR
jgi:hypothetical protein